MEMIRLIIDATAPIIAAIAGSLIIVCNGKRAVTAINQAQLDAIEKQNQIRFDAIEKQFREHIRGYSDEEQEFMEKVLNEVFSKPSMRC